MIPVTSTNKITISNGGILADGIYVKNGLGYVFDGYEIVWVYGGFKKTSAWYSSVQLTKDGIFVPNESPSQTQDYIPLTGWQHSPNIIITAV